MTESERNRRDKLKRKRIEEKRKRRIKRRIVLGILYTLTILLCLGVILVLKALIIKDPKANIYEVYGIDKEGIGVVVENEIVKTAKATVDKDIAYLDIDTVKKYCSERFYCDYSSNLVIFTTPTDVIKAAVGSSEYKVGSEVVKEDYKLVKSDGNTIYVAMNFVKKYCNIDFSLQKSKIKILVINNKWTDILTGKMKTTNIRMKDNKKSNILSKVKKGNRVIVYKKGKEWSLVRTDSGLLGYVKTKKIKGIKEVSRTRTGATDEEKKPVIHEYTNISKSYKINFVWDMVSNMSANTGVSQRLASTKGVTTISPTWFTLINEDGDISSLASNTYVQTCHALNVEVWGMVSNGNDADLTKKVLSKTESREKLASDIISHAITYKLDGVNIDFEALTEDTGEDFIQFIRELSVLCRKNNKVLSIANYVPKNHNEFYNRKEQGIVADYIMIMGYDEHYDGSDAGSVSSIGFVKEGIEKTLEQVPSDKVINAVPFYTRLWSVNENNEVITSKAYTMKETAGVLNQYGITVEWDNKVAQNYGEVVKDNITYKIWVEDVDSIEQKLKLFNEYNLAGNAAWRLGQETSNIWDCIQRYIN